jgi:hypothetical protein
MTEAQEQIALIKRCQFSGNPILRDYIFSIPNGGSRHKLEAVNLGKQGIMPGVSDLMLFYPVAPYHGLFLEMKRRFPIKGQISTKQKEFMRKAAKVGYATEVAYGWEEGYIKLVEYLEGKDS